MEVLSANKVTENCESLFTSLREQKMATEIKLMKELDELHANMESYLEYTYDKFAKWVGDPKLVNIEDA